LKLELPKTPGNFVKMEIASASGPEKWTPARITMLSGVPRIGSASGPVVDQFSGVPSAMVDSGTVLSAVEFKDGQDLRTFNLPKDAGASSGAEVAEIYLRIEVHSLINAGEYLFPIAFVSADGLRTEGTLDVAVADITLPSEQRVTAVATATMEEMTAAYPESFGRLQASYLDRTDPDSAAAVAQLDLIVRMAQKNGVAFFIEDLAPPVKIDEVGRVLIDWDGYDRVIAPYMDGTAFVDRVPLGVWLAPAPPRRVRDTPTQLRQYLQQCVEHFKERGWTQTPAFMHAALLEQGSTNAEWRKQTIDVIEKFLDRNFALVGTPDVSAAGLKAMWVVPEDDTRLPPANRLANAQSIRAWPWMCAARGLRGMVWRHAVQLDNTKNLDAMPLFISRGVDGEPDAALRLAWLNTGLNDAAHFGLVEKRTDAAMARQLLAGVVGRTGLGVKDLPGLGGGMGYLYAGWPTEPDVWEKLPGMLDVLILANEPGRNISPDDPQLLAAKMFLTRAHRPVSRIAGYSFGVFPGRDGAVIDLTTEFWVENPMGIPTKMDVKWPFPPGDFASVERNATQDARGTFDIPAYGQLKWPLKLTGRLDSIREAPKLKQLELVERDHGVVKEMQALVPIYRMRAAKDAPKIDGQILDWPMNTYFQSFGPMRVELTYDSRPGLLGGKMRRVDNAAEARWAFDKNYIYALIKCPQASVATEDQHTNEWPLINGRWWGTDGIQIQMAGGGNGGLRLAVGTRIVQLAIKPSGIALIKSGSVGGTGSIAWADAQLAGLKYAVNVDKNPGGGYLIEVAIPRAWFPKDHDADEATPVWRINLMRHVGADMTSASWSGPVVGDLDVGMMGLLTGEE
jgi:hypothetical protein